MLKKYASPILAGLVSGFLMTGMYSLAAWYLGIGKFSWALLLASFFSSFILSAVLFEMFAYRQIRAYREASEKEIHKLKDMERFRRDFLGDVSHELKTPIFAIEGFIETLLGGALDDEKVNRRFLSKALKQAERLSSLVQDILTLSQVESGELSMHQETFTLHELVKDTVDSLEHKFTKKGRNILCLVQANRLERMKVVADKHRIQQVLVNLIDNAVKYGDMKGIVTVELNSLDENRAIIRVKDNGPGIAPEHISRLFERFYRVDKSRSREKGGTGLGLAICKHLVEAHGEKIWAESKPGEGATFSFTLKRLKEAKT